LSSLSEKFAELKDVLAWRDAALSTAARAALFVTQDLSAAMEQMLSELGLSSALDDEVTRDVLVWAVGDGHDRLRTLQKNGND